MLTAAERCHRLHVRLHTARSCRSRELRGRYAVEARAEFDRAVAAGVDVEKFRADLEALEHELAQGVLPW